ncbi:MAG: 5-(carboxyamino)imidazole ribonucleotide mutase [Thermovirgaceae bacterium]|nr:5-(carboxyamino)imidazole ribonucleotide mutase [Synergistales bacterium]MDI9392150.1 5-(carboxyamino)imidazole ribonucleotide mutase [Synergistota bacterium]MDY0178747.1 5-(carboxyamino)imidazole ribonucleotide mutase [Synergistaceae bacterium]HRW87688.1 5-(carboxyamino)imidazole ribonucleotide mutase [Thermovirgaceae bacterium]MDD3829532.1 5-(carboxyamino)imidazole ribonucleotide mutase [Synergistales bacterium]
MEGPVAGIVLGSVSDLDLGVKAKEVFETLGIPYEITVASAHRTPDDVVNYARNAKARGIKVIVAVAGLSAALPGVIAAHTTIPVIGVPAPAGTLGGIDALLSIAQMPPGVPVGTMGIGAARNAALFAARIISLFDDKVHEKVWEDVASARLKVTESRKEISDLPLAPSSAFREL